MKGPGKSAEKRKKTTVEIPEALLKTALRVSGRSLNETVKLGLQLVAAQEAFDELIKLRGTYRSKISVDTLREES